MALRGLSAVPTGPLVSSSDTACGFLHCKQLLPPASGSSPSPFPYPACSCEPRSAAMGSPSTALVGSSVVSGAHALKSPSSVDLLHPALSGPGQATLTHPLTGTLPSASARQPPLPQESGALGLP